jgi:hypothetical protein
VSTTRDRRDVSPEEDREMTNRPAKEKKQNILGTFERGAKTAYELSSPCGDWGRTNERTNQKTWETFILREFQTIGQPSDWGKLENVF